MNLKRFNELNQVPPAQHPPEFQMFLEICEMYLEKHGIKKPIVVELGTRLNHQKKFWVELFDAEHIGIDASVTHSTPDIVGNTHDPETMKKLKEKLNGRPINILFIDASHHYEDVKQDFEMYHPLCPDIAALHDIETGRFQNKRRRQVWRFWDELKKDACTGVGYSNFLFVSVRQHKKKIAMGIGMVIKTSGRDKRQL